MLLFFFARFSLRFGAEAQDAPTLFGSPLDCISLERKVPKVVNQNRRYNQAILFVVIQLACSLSYETFEIDNFWKLCFFFSAILNIIVV